MDEPLPTVSFVVEPGKEGMGVSLHYVAVHKVLIIGSNYL
jgi:hypothetical protein